MVQQGRALNNSARAARRPAALPLANQNNIEKRCQRGTKTLPFKSSSVESTNFRSGDVDSEALVQTISGTLAHTRSTNLSSCFSGNQAVLPPAPEIKTGPSDPLTSSLALVYHTLLSTIQRFPQCRLCLGPCAIFLLVPEYDEERLIQVMEKSIQARQAKRQYKPPQSLGSQSPETDVAIARVFKKEKEPPSMDVTVGCSPTAFWLEKILEMSRSNGFSDTHVREPSLKPETTETTGLRILRNSMYQTGNTAPN